MKLNCCYINLKSFCLSSIHCVLSLFHFWACFQHPQGFQSSLQICFFLPSLPKGKPRDTVILYACLLLSELQAEDKRNNFIPYPHMCKNAAREKKKSGLFTSLDKTQQIKADLLCQTSGYLNRQAVAKLEKACTTTRSELGFHCCS